MSSLAGKTILVLAASLYQLDAIRTAKRLGMRVVTTDSIPSNPGHALADRAYAVDTTDVEGVIEIAKAERIDGVIAPCTDVAVFTAARVAEELGLPGVASEAARIVTSKTEFRKFLAGHEMRVPRFVIVEANEQPPAGLFECGQRWIIKPERASGSKGIFILDSADDLAKRMPESRMHSPTGRLVIEQFIDGHQGTIEGVLRGGSVALSFILDRQTAPSPYVSTIGHYVPSVIDAPSQAKVVSMVEEAWRKLGVNECIFDCDFVLGDGQVYLIEMTPRLGGNSISQLLRVCAGVDLVELAVRSAMGDLADLPTDLPVKAAAVVLFGVWQSGRLSYEMSDIERCRVEPWLHSIQMDVEPGAVVEPFINGRHRLGEAYVLGSERSDIPGLVTGLNEMLALGVHRE
jgi:biotin carboxylase